MKSLLSMKTVMLFLLFAFAASAFASDGGKGNFQISDPVQVNGTTLPAGSYTAKWEGSGPDVQVSIVRSGKTIATVPAKLVQLDQKGSNDAAEYQTATSGKRELTALHFSGKKYSLQLGSTSAQLMKSNDSVK
ncbi:MAG TPA: hypothetical protein VN669_14500 [Candidatus Acidoferrales bacterium]|jgi:hypothetical protein|nr:hypothetical protein [Candidatus Acidoferrales bacterium]